MNYTLYTDFIIFNLHTVFIEYIDITIQSHNRSNTSHSMTTAKSKSYMLILLYRASEGNNYFSHYWLSNYDDKNALTDESKIMFCLGTWHSWKIN